MLSLATGRPPPNKWLPFLAHGLNSWGCRLYVSVALPPTIVKVLEELAGGRDVGLFIADLIVGRLDPSRRVEVYLKLSEDYLRAAEELYSKGDLTQAGEKYWGAVAALLNAIGELRGWDHYSHRDYDVIIDRLYEETGDKSIMLDFSVAERLHANFYHNFTDKRAFEVHRQVVLGLIERLKGLIKLRSE